MATIDEIRSNFKDLSGLDVAAAIDGENIVIRVGDVGSVGVAAKDMDLPIDVFTTRYIRPAVFALLRRAGLLPADGQKGGSFKPMP